MSETGHVKNGRRGTAEGGARGFIRLDEVTSLRSDNRDTMCLLIPNLVAKEFTFQEHPLFCHEGGYYAGASNKPFLRASKKAVPLEASLGEFTPLVLGS